MELYDKTTYHISGLVTRHYSTSFYMATSLLERDLREAIFSIYGFVRFADEIVDSFHEYDKKMLLEKFEKDYYECVDQGISMNPILHSFRQTVKKYDISDQHIQAFLKSMKADLRKKNYKNRSEMRDYIYGSADVVGLMCLKVFCEGNEKLYVELEDQAMRLGSAFQKVNFLRDLKNDLEFLDRSYFSEIQNGKFDESVKRMVIKDIGADFNEALTGIKKLPRKSKLAVLVAYYFYKTLLRKIRRTPAERIIKTRIRVRDFMKWLIFLKAYLVYRFRLV